MASCLSHVFFRQWLQELFKLVSPVHFASQGVSRALEAHKSLVGPCKHCSPVWAIAPSDKQAWRTALLSRPPGVFPGSFSGFIVALPAFQGVLCFFVMCENFL